MKFIKISDLLEVKPLEKIVEFPIKFEIPVYYKIREIKPQEKEDLKTQALLDTINDLKAKKIIVDSSVSKEELTYQVSMRYKELYEYNLQLGFILATTVDAETDQKLFPSKAEFNKLNTHTHVFSLLMENYTNFVEETSPYINGNSLDDIQDLANQLKENLSESFLDNAVQNLNNADCKRLIQCLVQKLKQTNFQNMSTEQPS